MRITAFLLLVMCLSVAARTHSQNITLNVQNLPLEDVFAQLEVQSGYFFNWSSGTLQGHKKVNLIVKNMPLIKVLDTILKGSSLNYNFRGKIIVIAAVSSNPSPQPKSSGTDELFSSAPIRGKVLDSVGQPLSGATVSVKGGKVSVVTNVEGVFSVNVSEGDVLFISYVGYETRQVVVTKSMFSSANNLVITLKPSIDKLEEVVIKGNTGYQVISKKHPGSFDMVDNKLLNRKISSNILDRIENLTPGVSFNNINDGLLIRGRNSIFSNVNPLIVLDNFPYDGDLNSINPNDIESITILKDAASAAQWGARSGNGVIVITTKKGKTNKPQVDINSNVTAQGRPDLNSIPVISGADFIEVEKWLFGKKYYDALINNSFSRPPLTPVVEILNKERNGQISPAESALLIEKYKQIDTRDDLRKYFYRNKTTTRNSVALSGFSSFLNYYLAVGWDPSTAELVGQKKDRVSIRSQNIFKVSSDLTVDVALAITQNSNRSGNNPGVNINSGAGKLLYPYADLVDDQGKSLILVKDLRSAYTDTAGNGQLLDWKYRPLDDIAATTNSSKLRDILLNVGANYKLSAALSIEVKYQFLSSNSATSSLQSLQSYSTRDMINRFYQPNAVNKYPIPLGGILRLSNSDLYSHQGRVQLQFSKQLSEKHTLSSLAGWEIKDLSSEGNSHYSYGYIEEGNRAASLMDFVTEFPQFNRPAIKTRISNPVSLSKNKDRFLSYYFNGIYSYDDRLTVSASLRNDAANLFGVETNQKGVPLWSIGGSWEISKERFYRSQYLTYLRFRATYGYNGNFSRLASALTTIEYSNVNQLGNIFATIVGPPNKKLRWEQVGILNLGLDFVTKNNKINGSIELYSKSIKDLMAQAPIDPTTGQTPPLQGGGPSFFYGNVANMNGKGIDFQVNLLNTIGELRWHTAFIFSYTLSKVTKYLLPATTNSASYIVMSGSGIVDEGRPVYSILSYRWGGLDPSNGDPIGYYGKDKSKDYYNIINNTKIDSLIYNGPVNPPIFGAIRNTISWRQLSLSLGISYKFGHFFRRPSINYGILFNNWTGNKDFANRWKRSGDENHTSVPSMPVNPFSVDYDRGTFYEYANVLVEKADNIRFDDMMLDYLINKGVKKTIIKSIRIYCNIENLNWVLWRANKAGLDPAFFNTIKPGKSISIGLNVSF